MFVPESLRRQNELIQTLQKQLEATERELADQKWILDQYLNSPSWRLTAPLRWVARTMRSAKRMFGGTDTEPSPPAARTTPIPNDITDSDASEKLKELSAAQYRVALQSFIASNALLPLPTCAEPDISIIIITFNRAELTFACLRSIAESFYQKLEVIIVDNASTDETSELLNRIRGAHIIRNGENLNFLLAVNQGAREARAPYLLMLNNDAQLLPGTLESALATMKSDDRIGAVGGRLVLLDGRLQEAGSIVWQDGSCLGYGRGDNPLSSAYMFRRDVDYCSAAFLMTPRKVWQDLGGFDETFKPAYYEETDYCMRLWARGLRVVYEPAAVVLHYEFASSKSTKSALNLQTAHHAVFAKTHSAALQQHLPADPANILAARTHPASGSDVPLRLLYIDDRVPHPYLGSGFPRARTMLLALRKQGYALTIFTLATSQQEWASIYSDFPRDIEVMNELGATLLEAFFRVRHSYYDVIVVSRPHNMEFLRPVVEDHPDWFEKVPIIYDAEALFAPRDIGLRQLNGETMTADKMAKIYKDEVSLASIADCVIAVSERDRSTFVSHGIERVHVLGHSLEAFPTPATFEQRSGFLFIGAVRDEPGPNEDSLIWFLSDVWPLIRSRLGDRATFTIAGVNESQKVRELATNGVQLVGRVDDLSELYNRIRVFIAPTRFAAGIPHKVHEAASRGVPVVATSVLSKQLAWSDGVQMSVADEAQPFAEKCLELHEDSNKWERLRSTALDAIRKECSTESFEKRLTEILRSERVGTIHVSRKKSGSDGLFTNSPRREIG